MDDRHEDTSTTTFNTDRSGVVYYVDAPCAAGKTYSQAAYIAKNLGIIPSSIKPSKRLGVTVKTAATKPCIRISTSFCCSFLTTRMCEQFVGDLQRAGIPQDRIVRIDRTIYPNEVIPTLRKALLDYAGLGKVVVCSHEALRGLPYFPRTGWQTIVDEIPPVERTESLRIPRSGHMLGQWLQIEPCDSTYVRVIPKSKSQLERHLKADPIDEFELAARKIYRAVLNPFQSVWVERRKWLQLVEGVETGSNSIRLTFFFALNPEALNKFTIMGANFVGSPTYEWLKMKGVKLVPHKELMQNLRFTEHPARKMEICFALQKNRFSKGLRNKDDFAFLKEYEKAVLSRLLLSVAQFLLHANVDYQEGEALDLLAGTKHTSLLTQDDRCIPLPATPHGLNLPEFQACTTVVTLGAFNRNPVVDKFLTSLGLSRQCLDSSYFDVVYQAVCRCNIRVLHPDPETGALSPPSDPILIVVPDEGLAKYLQARFPGSKLTRLDGEFKQFEAMTSTERSRKFRRKRKRPDIDIAQQAGCNEYLKGLSKENVACLRPAGNVLSGSHLDFAEAANPVTETIGTFAELASAFNHWVELRHLSKSEQLLYNLSRFDGSGRRTSDAVIGSDGCILDFDDGNLSPQRASEIMREAGIAHAVVSSFNRCRDRPNKFHLVVPFSTTAETQAEHTAVINFLIDVLEHHGFTEESMKLDRVSWNWSQFFYLPQTNKAHLDFAYFNDAGTIGEALSPDPKACVQLYDMPIDAEQRDTVLCPLNLSEHQHDEMIEQMRIEFEGMRTNRHRPTFEVGLRLARNGVVKDRISEVLTSFFGTDAKAQRHIKWTLRSLERYGHLSV